MPGTPGIAGAIMKEYRDSLQDVRIALTRYRANEDDPYSVAAVAGSEQLDSAAGSVIWYQGTGYQNQDSFFAHGGFFSGDRPTYVDTGLFARIQESSNTVNQVVVFRLSAGDGGAPAAPPPLKIMYKLPDGWTYVGSTAPNTYMSGCGLEMGTTVVCTTSWGLWEVGEH